MDQNIQAPIQNVTEVLPQGALESKATKSLILGIIGMVAWFIPIIGFPIQIVGLVFGIKSLHSTKSGRATAGIVLCVIGLVFSTINAGIGAYLGATGQYPQINQMFSR